MKKIASLLMTAALVVALFTGLATPAFAEEGLKLSGEAKSGVYWEETQTAGDKADRKVKIHNNDGDSGSNQGRFRLNMDYEREDGFGMRTRFTFHEFKNDLGGSWWSYGFGYGNFFERQLTVSVGKLGGSPWGTGGPEMWKELEESTIGMRVEYKPSFVPGLNVGFVLSDFNDDKDQGISNEEFAEKITIMELIKEMVVGVSYTHDWGLARLAYRFDSELDAKQDNKTSADAGKGEDEIVYRVEERVLKNYVPGLQLWVFGHLFGLSAVDKNIQWFRNWFIAQYEPVELFGLNTPFTAQFRLGYNAILSRSELFVKPSFYWNFFDKLISVGTAFTYAQDFGEDKIQGDHPFYYMEIEPKIQLNFTSSYIAFVYNFRREYFHDFNAIPGFDPIMQKQIINLRFCIYY